MDHKKLQPFGKCFFCDDGHAGLKIDNNPKHLAEVEKLMPEILKYFESKKTANAYSIYSDLGCPDITMYVALHNLVQSGALYGQDPYACGASHKMTEWIYKKPTALHEAITKAMNYGKTQSSIWLEKLGCASLFCNAHAHGRAKYPSIPRETWLKAETVLVMACSKRMDLVKLQKFIDQFPFLQ